ncbi:restriction endonuclease [bacterium]|nr:restriction endonuclease [bacterium]|tara:strand:- start:5822 stop:8230 length:2409 start_codon:yes stop_codon:yes gene_type:complete
MKYSEDDTRAKFIDPALIKAGWDESQIKRNLPFTAGRIIVRGKVISRGQVKRADYVLYYKENIPLAIVEAKDNAHSISAGMQQGLDYSKYLQVPFIFSSNGLGFQLHDKSVTNGEIEKELKMDEFPSPEDLWNSYKKYSGIETEEQNKIASQSYHSDSSGKSPRYYQQVAINRTVEAVAKEQKRILLTMATGTGKTYTAFQIAHRLFKAGAKRKILFLADRTALIDQTLRGDFRHFGDAMTVIKKKMVSDGTGDRLVSDSKRGIDTADKAYDIFLGLYQGLSNSNPGIPDAFKDFSEDFFDLIIVDECHRGSVKEDSKWREILEYFSSATHIGLTATPKETLKASNSEYFGDPIYTYSLRQGIDDGFLAPYKVVKVTLDIDVDGWRPSAGYLDKTGKEVEDRIYNLKDFDRNIVVEERRKLVAKKITEFLKNNDRFSKTIVFCTDIEHAEGMRVALANENADLVSENSKYVMRITGDNEEGKRELDNFINPSEKYPVIAVTSKLMTTGVDAQTCKLIVLDSNIGSMTEFKQIIGRGTRINEEYGKTYFTIMDFRNVTQLFADKDFDGDPIVVKEFKQDDVIALDDDNTSTEVSDSDEINSEGEVIIDPPMPEWSVPKDKVMVNGVEVKVINERVQYLDSDGKIITESLKDYTKKNIIKKYRTLDDFLSNWNGADKKKAIVDELENQGVFFDLLKEEVGKDFDAFDLVCHVAFDAKPLTRKERVENVKKRNYFSKYGEQAQLVIKALLDKYSESGILNLENIEALRLDPINKIGTPVEIISFFGGRPSYMTAIRELEEELYAK